MRVPASRQVNPTENDSASTGSVEGSTLANWIYLNYYGAK